MRGNPNQDYRQVLRALLRARQRSNPQYSLRAFSRDLGLSSSRLSQILRNREGLSQRSARAIAGALGLSPLAQEHFCTLVESQSGRSAASRAAAQHVLRTRFRNEKPVWTADRFQTIADWYHFAILHLVETRGFDPRPSALAQRLGITPLQAELAWERLQRLELVARDGPGWRATGGIAVLSRDVPSGAMRRHHHQILCKAARALDRHPRETRDFSTLTFAIDPAKLGLARRHLFRFRRAMDRLLSVEARRKTQVYCLSMQLFSLETSVENAHD